MKTQSDNLEALVRLADVPGDEKIIIIGHDWWAYFSFSDVYAQVFTFRLGAPLQVNVYLSSNRTSLKVL